ncbi:IPP transferase-domain-containing protein [Pilobolus umbonatus]|nr:IPP transferase-domain-containing protein [Pilobolus umbonatus]
MANKWHPSDRRKILRSLKVDILAWISIHHQTGQLQSDIIKSQQENIETEGLKPRYKSLIFWIYSDSVNLNPRLDKRVDQMIDTGLFEEIKDLRQRVVQGRVTIPGYEMEKYQRGLWQAIGYKEFDPYFNELEAGKSDAELEKIKKDCTERMKAATRRYAKRQVQWIRNKLLPTVYHSDNDDVMVYLLDANDIDTWNINVRDKAIEIARAFQSDSTMPDPFTINDIAATILSKSKDAMDTQTRVLSWKKYTCDVCKDDKGEVLVLNGDKEWEQHKKSRYHRKYIKHLRVEEMRKAYMNSKKVEAKIRALSVLQIE